MFFFNKKSHIQKITDLYKIFTPDRWQHFPKIIQCIFRLFFILCNILCKFQKLLNFFIFPYYILSMLGMPVGICQLQPKLWKTLAASNGGFIIMKNAKEEKRSLQMNTFLQHSKLEDYASTLYSLIRLKIIDNGE